MVEIHSFAWIGREIVQLGRCWRPCLGKVVGPHFPLIISIASGATVVEILPGTPTDGQIELDGLMKDVGSLRPRTGVIDRLGQEEETILGRILRELDPCDRGAGCHDIG